MHSAAHLPPRRTQTWVLTALAPAIWGTTFIVFTQTLPPAYPVWVASLRGLPAGLILLALGAGILPRAAVLRVVVLGVANISGLSALLLTSAARLPGGLTATLGALQPGLVALLAWPLLGRRPSLSALGAALLGVLGVGVLTAPGAHRPDLVGLIAGVGAAASMALGTVLTERWRDLAASSTLAAWQLIFGGLVLLPIAALMEGQPPPPTPANVLGLTTLILPGTALTYWLWVRGLTRLGPQVAFVGLLSPLVATLSGAWLLHERLGAPQYTGMVLILGSTLLGIHLQGTHASRPAKIRRLAQGEI